MTSTSCPTCTLLRHAMGVSEPMDRIAGAVEVFRSRTAVELAELVMVVGARGMGLPIADDVARGPYVFGAMLREDILTWARGNPEREAIARGLTQPLPSGRVWILAAVGTRARGMVVCLHHDLPRPSAEAREVMALALVPEDGGPAPGRRIVRGGRG